MSKLQEELDQERHKARTAMHKQQQEIHLQQQKLALMNGSRFAALILRQAAGPELEQRLFELLLSQLKQLPEACIQSLQTVDSNTSLEINVSHAYPITHEQQQRLEQKFASLIDNPMQFQYDQNTHLIAGFKIDIGAWILHADLQHELSGFTEIARDF
nr:F0F1 ATP synthase subunit delta [Methylomarinum sp. Ch1-1]MDP4521542.1 F0F1 ATP synthase subunit delta [Methylomarinum sp. Ch1-1]